MAVHEQFARFPEDALTGTINCALLTRESYVSGQHMPQRFAQLGSITQTLQLSRHMLAADIQYVLAAVAMHQLLGLLRMSRQASGSREKRHEPSARQSGRHLSVQ